MNFLKFFILQCYACRTGFYSLRGTLLLMLAAGVGCSFAAKENHLKGHVEWQSSNNGANQYYSSFIKPLTGLPSQIAALGNPFADKVETDAYPFYIQKNREKLHLFNVNEANKGETQKTPERERVMSKDIDKQKDRVKKNVASPSTSKPRTAFSLTQLMPLLLSFVLVLASIILFQYQENKSLSIVLLLLASFGARLFAALLNPHLNLWDEQFHALVAKNMMEQPFKPMLYANPVMPYSDTSWTGGHIWLHKQPLFLWQMALSMKLLGVNVLALRLPSVVMSTLVTLLIYRVGSLTLNKTAAFMGALIFAFSHYAIELAAGALATDHNDVAFLFYVSASIWAWVEYEKTGNANRRWLFIILIGLFSGGAILTKWLTGLLVYSGWGMSILLSANRRWQWRQYRNVLLSLLVTVAVFLPWQLYIAHTFPALSQYEYELNTRHFFEVIEGHSGGFWWHFGNAFHQYGVHFILLVLCLVIFWKVLSNSIYKIAFFTYIILIYGFFSMAATKMMAFTYSVSLLMYLAIGAALFYWFKVVIVNPHYLPQKVYRVIYQTLILACITGYNLDVEGLRERHTVWKKEKSSRLYQRLSTISFIKNLSSRGIAGERQLLFNLRPYDATPVMFFNDIAAAYANVPSRRQIQALKEQGYQLAVLDNDKLPQYILNDQEIEKIEGYWDVSKMEGKH